MNSYDIVIYGGTAAGVTAAVQAARMSCSVALVCPEKHLGGLTTSGLGWTDSKNGDAIGGLAREFYGRVWLAYASPARWTRQTRESYLEQKVVAQPGMAIEDDKQVMWTFEPHVAQLVMDEWIASENIEVFRDEWLDRETGVEKSDGRIESLRTLSGKTFRGKMFIDAGYEGDLMAASGVSFRVGRDSAGEFGESLGGVRFPVEGVDSYSHRDDYLGVDPFVVPGQSESGFLPGIEGRGDHLPLGVADSRLQGFNYRLCLTTQSEIRAPILKPEGYDEREYELLFRLFAAGQKSSFTTQLMPNFKTDSNSQGRFSGDFVGGNYSLQDGWNYSDASYEKRAEIVAAHRSYQQGLLWTLQNHPRVPPEVREELGVWGLASDEFGDNEHWPHQLYVREARRLVGQSVVTQHHVQLQPGFEVLDSIGLGSYSLDSHVVRRVVVAGRIRDEGGFYIWHDKPYPLPLGCIVPQFCDVTNLLTPTTPSATHAAFGSIRMEPTYMILGQAAATIAVLALREKTNVQNVDYSELAEQLRADGQVLAPPEA